MQFDILEGGAVGKPRALEFRTIVVAIAIYAAWAMVTAFHAAIPILFQALIGGVILAWHGSLQHETIHGHPTRWRSLNAAIGIVPLSMWLPYSVYRRTHLAHHATPNITDPFDDPESQYLHRASGLRYRLALAEQTLLGRLILGPALRICAFLLAELRRGMSRPRELLRDWMAHLVGVAVLLVWLHHCDFPVANYILTFVYPGTALSLLRSFAEHRADDNRGVRAAIIPKPGPFGMIFLNNNLHAVHHARPDLPWYELPAQYHQHRETFEGVPSYKSYWVVIRRYMFRPHDRILHPDYDAGRSFT
ncbi:MAG: fatty acid desaturase [Novosphingobium sp.]|nr:fatty acid desaturase [Novosphingobium sp.]